MGVKLRSKVEPPIAHHSTRCACSWQARATNDPELVEGPYESCHFGGRFCYSKGMATHENCPFCNSKERIVKQNELAQVVLSNPRKVPGHFLVLPKRHVEKPWELTSDEITSIFELIFAIE